jgi:hypothetical protein
MATVAAELPPLSEVESASFDHLTDAAAYYRRAADSMERAFTAVRNAARQPGGTDWAGQAQEANLAARERDLVIATGAVRLWQEADTVCTLGFEQMTASKQSTLEAVAEVRAAGFNVADNYTVTDTSTGGTAEQRQIRRAQAEEHRNFIQHRVALLVAHDREIAAKMDATLGDLADITFDEHEPTDGRRGHIQAVDQHTFKQGPAPPAPPGNPFADWTEEQKLQVAQEIAQGHAGDLHKRDFPGMSEDDIARWVHDTMNDPSALVGTSKQPAPLPCSVTEGSSSSTRTTRTTEPYSSPPATRSTTSWTPQRASHRHWHPRSQATYHDCPAAPSKDRKRPRSSVPLRSCHG